jgi:ribulose-phosphate 3-epimerase
MFLQSRSRRITISASLLAADFCDLGAAIDAVNASPDVDSFHVDIMDGSFVNAISFGQPVLASLQPRMRKPCNVHLMAVDPERHIASLAALGASSLTVHYEACPHLHRALTRIRQAGMKAGVALNPHTPVEAIRDMLHLVDIVCIMTVDPGAGGQGLIEAMLPKVTRARAMLDGHGSTAVLQVDGGVNATTSPLVASAGADELVVGSALFGAGISSFEKSLESIRNAPTKQS